jgi:hypothetical protein
MIPHRPLLPLTVPDHRRPHQTNRHRDCHHGRKYENPHCAYSTAFLAAMVQFWLDGFVPPRTAAAVTHFPSTSSISRAFQTFMMLALYDTQL